MLAEGLGKWIAFSFSSAGSLDHECREQLVKMMVLNEFTKDFVVNLI